MPKHKPKKRRKPKRPLRRPTRRSKAPRRNSKPPAPARSAPASPQSVAAPYTGPPKRLSEAMREQGLDETKVAAKFNSLLDRVDKKGHEKLMLDTLKECSKRFDEDAAARTSFAADAPAIIQLVHNIPRPETPASPGPAPDEEEKSLQDFSETYEHDESSPPSFCRS